MSRHPRSTELQGQILVVLRREEGFPLSTQAVANAVGKKVESIRYHLASLERSGELECLRVVEVEKARLYWRSSAQVPDPDTTELHELELHGHWLGEPPWVRVRYTHDCYVYSEYRGADGAWRVSKTGWFLVQELRALEAKRRA